MKLLDRIVQVVLACCIGALALYIIFRGISIAQENGLFQNTPLLSAVYQKISDWTAGTYIPVLSYVEKQNEKDSGDWWGEFSREVSPVYGYALNQKEHGAVESSGEYEMIVQAQALAEENKQPREIEDFLKEQDVTLDFQNLLNNYFSMDMTTTIDPERLDGEKLMAMDMTMTKDPDVPQILIYHTHSQEAFVDSVEGDDSTTIVGIGDYLTELLTEDYGYNVIHERGVFDLVDGVLDRNAAYDYSEAAVQAILDEYPSIEMVIDLHRDGVDGIHFVTDYQGKPTAKLMFIAGMSRTADGQDISYLPNPYIEDNLALALQLQMRAEKMAPDLMRNIYLMAYRFNLHLRPKSLLLEAGTQLNTIEEEKNAMEAFAKILDDVLKSPS